jgi:predicted metal-dependent HD superfamily phosphohydrolase
MGDPSVEIRRAWDRLAGRGHEAIVDDLLLRYEEPHRRYHDANHLMWVLRHMRELLRKDAVSSSLSKDDREVLTAAALFHDVIYCPRSKTSEADSARLAVSRLANLGWSARRMELVTTLIEATAGHEATTPAEAVLLDADLAILGAPAARYARYVAAVREEYSHVNDAQWRTGRAAVLSTFLDRDHVFATETMRAQREAQAQYNLAAELDRLSPR